MYRSIVLGALLVVFAAHDAAAQGFVSPFIGTTLTSPSDRGSSTKPGYGVSFGSVGQVVGFDTEFAFYPEVIDNSATEREFQNVAKLRLNMLFAGSTEGAHRACVLLGIVATCRAIGVPVQAYLAWAFDRLGTHREDFGLAIEDMTPAAFKRAPG